MQFGTHLLFLASWLFDAGHSLKCYSCTASLSSAVDEGAQVAMRIFLETTYYLPPVHHYCALEDDIEFKTVPTAQCAGTDKCVKISAHGKGQGLQFVIRGCESQIYKPNIGVRGDIGCRSKESPSLCYCTEDFCNTANSINFSRTLLASFFLVFLTLFLF